MSENEASAATASVDTGVGPEVSGAATVAASERRGVVGKLFGVCLTVPWFVHVLWMYVILQLAVSNVRESGITVGVYELLWVEILYVVAIVVAMAELMRVSGPGIDNTKQAIFMLLVGVVYLVLFVVATFGTLPGSWVFSNSEFFVLLLISWTQVVMGFLINARTLKRTIGYSGGEAG